VTAPRLEVDLAKVEHNARALVDRLGAKGIRVTGVTKAVLGASAVAAAMQRGGVVGLGDSRIENLTRLRDAGLVGPTTLIRTSMLSQVDAVVVAADVSMNTETAVLAALDAAAQRAGTTHRVVLMVELGDLREGIAAGEIVEAAVAVKRQPHLRLAGLGTNLACQSGVVPDQSKMDELTALVEQVEARIGRRLDVVSGGNSANLDWALAATDVGRVDDLRLGEAILLGTEPLHRRPVEGLHLDAFTLVAEVIEVATKPSQPWGEIAQGAFGAPPVRTTTGPIRQAILALGRQDVEPDGLVPPPGIDVLGMSSDHLVVDVCDHEVGVGQELRFGLGYGALVRAATSPFVSMCPVPPAPHRRPDPSASRLLV
jgi:predicted amino acid racemase